MKGKLPAEVCSDQFRHQLCAGIAEQLPRRTAIWGRVLPHLSRCSIVGS